MMPNEQIKFYVTPEEKLQIQKRAQERYLKAPTYAKLCALGVELAAPEKIYVPSEPIEVIKEVEIKQNMLMDEDIKVLRELVSRINDAGYTKIDLEFQKEVKAMALRLLEGL